MRHEVCETDITAEAAFGIDFATDNQTLLACVGMPISELSSAGVLHLIRHITRNDGVGQRVDGDFRADLIDTGACANQRPLGQGAGRL